MPPSTIFALLDVGAQRLNVERVVPINDVGSHIVSLLVVVTESCISVSLDIVGVGAIVCTDALLKLVALLELEISEVDQVFEDPLASVILSHELDEFIDDPL